MILIKQFLELVVFQLKIYGSPFASDLILKVRREKKPQTINILSEISMVPPVNGISLKQISY